MPKKKQLPLIDLLDPKDAITIDPATMIPMGFRRHQGYIPKQVYRLSYRCGFSWVFSYNLN